MAQSLQCSVCGDAFSATRATKKTCSSTCAAVAYWRRRVIRELAADVAVDGGTCAVCTLVEAHGHISPAVLAKLGKWMA